MPLTRRAARGRGRRPRFGLVLGSGGVLGAAWMAGALEAVQERIGQPLADAEIVLGTSAGSVLAASLRCGVGIDTIVAHQRGTPLGPIPHLADIDRDSGARPPLPRLRLGSPRLLATIARAPHRMHPWVAASALVPQGRAQHRTLASLVHGLLAQADERGGGRVPAAAWPRRQTWIMAVDYESGRRVAFGRPGSPPASLPDAVVASCSIPGWYEPKVIDKRRYVDGGVRSSTSLDLLAKLDLDEAYVLAPMASYEPDHPRHPALRAERLLRQVLTNALTREVRKVERAGVAVTILTPGPDDLAAFGMNLMDPGRRVRVLDTSLRTSPRRLAALPRMRPAA
jgi:NTE family protein